MMIGRRHSAYIDPLTIARAQRVSRIIDNIGVTEPIVYWEDIYGKIVQALRANRLYPLGGGLKIINPTDPTNSKLINENINKIANSLDYTYLAMGQLPDYLNTLTQSIASIVGDASENIKKVQGVLGEVEAAAQKRRNSNSIKNEKRIVETFDNDINIDTTTLDLDQANGAVTLRKLNITPVPYTIDNVFIPNKQKMRIPSHVKHDIKPGYYFGNFYGVDPLFEPWEIQNRNNEQPHPNDLKNVNDGNLSTSFQTEYVTDSNEESLEVQLKLKLSGQDDIDLLSISTNSFGTQNWVEIKELKSGSEEYTDTLIGNGIRIKGDLLSHPNKYITPNKSDAFPKFNGLTKIVKPSEITLTLKQAAFNKIRIPRMRKVALNNIVLREFNYLESFILRSPNVDTKRFSPYRLHHNRHELATEYDSNNPIVEVADVYNRYVVGVRELAIFRHDYASQGLLTTKQYNTPGDIISLEIYTDEYIPEGTELRYKVLLDGDISLPLIPVNRKNISDDDVYRYVFNSNFNVSDHEALHTIITNNFKIQVEMTGQNNTTPVLRTLIIRAKVE